MMHLTPWHLKRLALVCTLSFLSYSLFRLKTYTIVYEELIANQSAQVLGEFVADFSNLRKLNPTILEFYVTKEHGNYEHWQYSVKYKEVLSQLSFITNVADASIQVLPSTKTRPEFIILSHHVTCFFDSYFTCVRSESEFKFLQRDQDVIGMEKVHFQCPAIMSAFCHREVLYQRQEIFDNLKKMFSNKVIAV
ncbi:hypothetical protein M8J76_003668 [Diaphorina citri]|nr:hypothetical protein M8J76_003668 [Diaphorina citri]